MKKKKKKPRCACEKHKGNCYAMWINSQCKGGPVFSMALCPVCTAHLAPSGICLNGCHMSPKSGAKFTKILKDLYAVQKPGQVLEDGE